ncbi:uncharacterized protein LOC113505927 [Trichoplusia ni]|uniref:Uncharacterized protein LOC113505927 n=1 Tax=Trichoplusia ni TaxID=7111 RepID=A0A7E5WUU6_TRINI|nr:uncharacterized protein LOC113505927 [Trichoplusia ni]
MFSTPVFIFAVLCFVSVKSERKLCDFNDEKCLTDGSNRSFEKFIAGIPGVPPSDPLVVGPLEGSSPPMKYKVHDASLVGMKNCKVDKVGIDLQTDKYKYQVKCPHLTIDLKTEVHGDIGEGKGTCKITVDNYHLKYSGDYVKTQDANGKLHMTLKSHDLEEDPIGKLNIECGNADGSELPSDKWQAVGQQILKPTIESFTNKYISNVNAYLTAVPVEDMFYQE